MEIKYLPENTNPQNSDWLLTENDTAAQKLSVGNLLALAGTPDNLGVDNITGLQTALDNKVNNSEFSTLSTIVTEKANQSTVDALTTTVSGKIDKSLTEIASPSASDFLILEKASDGINKKVKISVLSSSSTVITSATEPSSPVQGMVWKELDANSNLIETWNRINLQWVSPIKELNYTIINPPNGNNYISYFPLPANRDFFLIACSGILTTNATLSSGICYLFHQLDVLSGTTKISDTNDPGSFYSNASLEPKISDLQSQINQQKVELSQTRTNLKDLDTKIKEQEKMNQSAIPKLDQILGLIPAIPARAAAAIRPDIPTIPQIETASATGTCRTLQTGGCSRKALDDLGNGINQNTNNQSNNLFDKLNAGANAAQLVLLKVIDNKLGDQIKGGLSAKLVDGFNWLKLDRALSVLTFAATVQNHVMLSNNIGTTLLGAFGNVLSLIGLKDDQGQAYDVGSVINSSIEGFVKSIVGAENYATISETWAKANRIYQATTNMLNAFQSLSSTILSGMELIAGNNSKIGNALKKAGTVLDNAYGWMNPQPKFNRITQTLEKLQADASTIQMVTQAPLDIINATTELQKANTEFVKALKEDKPENKAPEIPEPYKLKADELVSKIGSKISNILPDDLFNAAD